MEKRLQNILAHAGVASRRKSAELIEQGRVKVDGKVVREKGLHLDPDAHEILVDGARVSGEERKIYFLLNKPKGMISTVTDTHGREKIPDLFEGVNERLYPVGRLDKDTTGLLIITNDGEMANKLSHPRYEVEKEYIAAVEGDIHPKDIKILTKGIEIEGKRTAPCVIELLKKKDGRATYRVKIHEGRKRQIRLMFEAAGARVAELKRTKYAGLRIGTLQEGEYRPLTDKEIGRLKRIGGEKER